MHSISYFKNLVQANLTISLSASLKKKKKTYQHVSSTVVVVSFLISDVDGDVNMMTFSPCSNNNKKITFPLLSSFLFVELIIEHLLLFRFWRAMNVLIAIWSVFSSSQNQRRFGLILFGIYFASLAKKSQYEDNVCSSNRSLITVHFLLEILLLKDGGPLFAICGMNAYKE